MRLLEASLLDFRNLAEVQLSFSPGVNVLLGDNGHGKTNVLEALNYPALARSFRGARDEELIRFGSEACHLRLAVAEGEKILDIEVGLDRGGRRRMRVDGDEVHRRVELVGRLATVVFDPQTVELVRGGPEMRRRWFDQGISSVDSEYLIHLQAANRALKQKASLLRDVRRGFSSLGTVSRDLETWNAELAAHAAPLVRKRADWLSRAAQAGRDSYMDLSDEKQELQLVYKQGVGSEDPGGTDADFSREILAVLDYITSDEIRRGRCLSGPQTDDVDIILDGVNLRTYGSRGETRTAAISLKLAQAEIVYGMRGVRPVLFFDDIFSELDKDRSRKLQERTAKDHQVFIATARAEDVAGWEPAGASTWTVHEGVVTIR